MAGLSHKKRRTDGKLQRPSKKQKRQQEYHSSSESEQDQDFEAVNLLDSDDDDIHNVKVEDVTDGHSDSSASDDDDVARSSKVLKKTKPQSIKAKAVKKTDAVVESAEDDNDDEEDDDDSEGDEYDLGEEGTAMKTKSKRNDPSAFATSLSKILSTKLSTSKRADPVLSRSAAAHEASKAAVDSALEAKARRHLKEQKRIALEKGRVKDVLLATNIDFAGDAETSTAEILALEKKLRNVAKRGVIKMFNAVRAAQVKAAEAEKEVRKAGMIGVSRREEKVNELTKKGFLDLIASGGGGLKKGALEEA